MPPELRVLVTGAGGFIGGRVTEVLHLTEGFRPLAGLRRWANGARVGRLPVEMVVCDVLMRDRLEAAMEQADAVVHCARGSHEVMVEGTRNVLACALEAGVRRVVHLSTCDVYGRGEGTFTEEHPLQRTGRSYGDAKIEAEEVCREFVEKGLPVVILRPTLVHGPFSASWTMEFAERIVGGWMLPSALGRGRCNLLYVDDLVAAVVTGLRTESGIGEAFNINGFAALTWNDYLRRLAAAMGGNVNDRPGRLQARVSSMLMTPVRKGAKVALEHFEGPILNLSQRSSRIRAAMKAMEHRVRMTPTSAEFEMYGRVVEYPTAKAARILGWRPQVSTEEAIRLTAAWLEHHGFRRDVPSPSAMGASA